MQYSRIRDELYCKHGVGHSDRPHGCDGCCSNPEWDKEWKNRKKWTMEKRREQSRRALEYYALNPKKKEQD